MRYSVRLAAVGYWRIVEGMIDYMVRTRHDVVCCCFVDASLKIKRFVSRFRQSPRKERVSKSQLQCAAIYKTDRTTDLQSTFLPICRLVLRRATFHNPTDVQTACLLFWRGRAFRAPSTSKTVTKNTDVVFIQINSKRYAAMMAWCSTMYHA
jgi:hypothetical protein